MTRSPALLLMPSIMYHTATEHKYQAKTINDGHTIKVHMHILMPPVSLTSDGAHEHSNACTLHRHDRSWNCVVEGSANQC